MMVPSGTGGRWALGVIVLVHVIAYNEVGGLVTLFGAILAALYSIFSAASRTGVKNVQIPYIRTTQRFDFLCLYLSVWMDILALLAACGALVRTLSTCLDTMTGGLARMWILGRNSSPNEPWPDVLGVSVVFLVTGMFMLGLENTKIFSGLMISGVLGIVSQIGIVTWLKGTTDNVMLPKEPSLIYKEIFDIVISGALLSFAYPAEYPNKSFRKVRNFLGYMFMTGTVLFFLALTSLSLTTLITQIPSADDFVAVPVLKLMVEKNLAKIIPAVACMLVLACSGAIMELFPEMYSLIVQLTSSEWKILAKQIGYENRESGSPVLAIFTGGSLCAMLAFACPLLNLIYILAASHFCATVLRTSYLVYSPFRPKGTTNHSESSTLNYSRLDSGPQTSVNVISIPNIKKIWNGKKIELPFNKGPKKSAKDKKNDEEVEKEWLLLGEPQSPRLERSDQTVEADFSIESAETQPIQSDVEILESKLEEDEDSSSTDIDAIVDEYRQKIKVTTAGPMDSNTLQIPTKNSWRFCIGTIMLLFSGIILFNVGVFLENGSFLVGGVSNMVMATIFLTCTPKYDPIKQGNGQPHIIVSVISLTFSLTFFFVTLSNSWPAIVFWLVAGLVFFIRCDSICCSCLDKPESDSLVPEFGSSQELFAPNGSHSKIVIPRPPKGFVISTRIPNHAR